MRTAAQSTRKPKPHFPESRRILPEPAASGAKQFLFCRKRAPMRDAGVTHEITHLALAPNLNFTIRLSSQTAILCAVLAVSVSFNAHSAVLVHFGPALVADGGRRALLPHRACQHDR